MKFVSNDDLGRPDKQTYRDLPKLPLTIVLDNVRSGLNIGSIFRTADSFLVKEIFLCGISATPPNREILKSALGATETVDWKYFKTTKMAIAALKSEGNLIYAVEQSDDSIMSDTFIPALQTPVALIFGHELKGVDPELIPMVDGCIEVPQSGTKHSLNVAVCAGIVIWEIYRKLFRSN